MSEYTRFFRCFTCSKALEMNEWMEKGNLTCACGGKRFFPTRLTKLEVAKYLLTHPAVLISTLLHK